MDMTVVWGLEQDKFDEGDASWCKGLGVETEVDHLYGDVYLSGKHSHRVFRGLRIRLISTCEKQETMLKLKYGHRLIELQRTQSISRNGSVRISK